jgi:DNA polymerase I
MPSEMPSRIEAHGADGLGRLVSNRYDEPTRVMRRVLLIDVFALLYRAFYGLPPMTTRAGEPTGAVYGLAVVVLKLLREERPDALAFAFDLPTPTFRAERFAGYKATRARAPAALAAQVGRARELVAALGAPAHAAPGFEADDVLATLTKRALADGAEVVVATGDNDCLQMARGAARVLVFVRGESKPRAYDEAAVRARFGVGPERLAERTALVGDASDDLPGVPGIGDRTAAALLARFDGLAGVLAHLDDVTPTRVREALRAAAPRLLDLADLARLRDDVPLAVEPLFAPIRPAARAAVRDLFEELEFRSLAPRVEAL